MLRTFKSDNRGFTLMELLMIIALIAILGLAGLSSFVDTSGSFTFLEKYKELASSVRGIRSLATTGSVTADRVGIIINKSGTKFSLDAFADNGTAPMELDDGDQNLPDLSHVLDVPFEIDVENSKDDFPLYIFYDIGGRDVSVIANDEALTDGAISLEFSDNENGFARYLVIFQVSGLIEEFDSSPL